MSATARNLDPIDPVDPVDSADPVDPITAAESVDPAGNPPVTESDAGTADQVTEYATRGARGHRAARPHLRIVSPLRPERAGRGLFALVLGGALAVGMIAILVINTTLAQGAFSISELQARQADLAQQEQTLSQAVAAAAAPRALERRARAMGMVPSENPVFVRLPGGRILGKPKPAGGPTATVPRLLTPADATVSEAVDNRGADLPQSVPVGYDPAAADAAAADAAGAQSGTDQATKSGTDQAGKAGKAGKTGKAGKKAGRGENGLWSDSTVIDVTGTVGSGDADLTAVPVG